MTKADGKVLPGGQGTVSRASKAQKPDPARLHGATDRLNAALLEFEAALQALNLGVSAMVDLYPDQDTDPWYTMLEFKKMGGAFKLVLTSGEIGGEDEDVTPICSASREQRLEAVKLLPKLYAKILEMFEAEVVKVEGSIEDVSELTRAVLAEAGK